MESHDSQNPSRPPRRHPHASQLGLPHPASIHASTDETASILTDSGYGASPTEYSSSSMDGPPESIADASPTLQPSDDEKFDVFDLELVVSTQSKKTELHLRTRQVSLTSSSSSGRPTYKAVKTPVSHFLSKKNLSLVVTRNEAWDANNGETIQPTGKDKTSGRKYDTIFEGADQNPRSLKMQGTNLTALTSTCVSGVISMKPCSEQNAGTARGGTGHHFFSLLIAGPLPDTQPVNLKTVRNPASQQAGPTPTEPGRDATGYNGGGYFVWDWNNRGRKEVLTTLYCTRYENRGKIRAGDILIAELRIAVPPPANVGHFCPWKRFFQTGHASLHISQRGLDSCFSGAGVRLMIKGGDPNNQYTLTKGQAQETIIATLAMSLLSIEHEGLESKKWSWLTSSSTPGPTPAAAVAAAALAASSLETSSVRAPSIMLPGSALPSSTASITRVINVPQQGHIVRCAEPAIPFDIAESRITTSTTIVRCTEPAIPFDIAESRITTSTTSLLQSIPHGQRLMSFSSRSTHSSSDINASEFEALNFEQKIEVLDSFGRVNEENGKPPLSPPMVHGGGSTHRRSLFTAPNHLNTDVKLGSSPLSESHSRSPDTIVGKGAFQDTDDADSIIDPSIISRPASPRSPRAATSANGMLHSSSA